MPIACKQVLSFIVVFTLLLEIPALPLVKRGVRDDALELRKSLDVTVKVLVSCNPFEYLYITMWLSREMIAIHAV